MGGIVGVGDAVIRIHTNATAAINTRITMTATTGDTFFCIAPLPSRQQWQPSTGMDTQVAERRCNYPASPADGIGPEAALYYHMLAPMTKILAHSYGQSYTTQ